MKRYQIYLNPGSVAVIDELEKLSQLSRSKIIREVIDRMADSIATTFASVLIRKKAKPSYEFFDKFLGSINTPLNKPINIKEEDREIYLKD